MTIHHTQQIGVLLFCCLIGMSKACTEDLYPSTVHRVTPNKPMDEIVFVGAGAHTTAAMPLGKVPFGLTPTPPHSSTFTSQGESRGRVCLPVNPPGCESAADATKLSPLLLRELRYIHDDKKDMAGSDRGSRDHAGGGTTADEYNLLADCCSSWSGAVLGLVAVLSCFVQPIKFAATTAAKSGRRTLRQTWGITAVWVCLFLVSLALPVSDAASWGWFGGSTLPPESNGGYGVSESCDTTCADIGGACDSDGFQAVDVAAMATIAGGSNGGCGEKSITDFTLTSLTAAVHPYMGDRCFISKAGTCAAKINNPYHDVKRFCPCTCPRGTYGGSTDTTPGCIDCPTGKTSNLGSTSLTDCVAPSVYWARTTTSESCDTLCGRGSGTCDRATMYNATAWTDDYMLSLSSAFGCPCDGFEASTMPSVPFPFGGCGAGTKSSMPYGGCCWYPSVTAMTAAGTTAADVCAAAADGKFCACTGTSTACPIGTSLDPTPAVLAFTTCIAGDSPVPDTCPGFTQTCPAEGTVTDSSTGLCNTATGYTGSGSAIAACAAGKYKSTTGAAACTDCSSAKGVSSEGSTAEGDCAAAGTLFTVAAETTIGGYSASTFDTTENRNAFKTAVAATFASSSITAAQIEITSITAVTLLSSSVKVSYTIANVPVAAKGTITASLAGADQSLLVSKMKSSGLSETTSAESTSSATQETPAESTSSPTASSASGSASGSSSGSGSGSGSAEAMGFGVYVGAAVGGVVVLGLAGYCLFKKMGKPKGATTEQQVPTDARQVA